MSNNNRHAKDQKREASIIANTRCPLCAAQPGQPCWEGTAPHDARRGTEDLRATLHRCHRERRALWVGDKQGGGA